MLQDISKLTRLSYLTRLWGVGKRNVLVLLYYMDAMESQTQAEVQRSWHILPDKSVLICLRSLACCTSLMREIYPKNVMIYGECLFLFWDGRS